MCVLLLQAGAACLDDYNCVENGGCYNGVCTPYFSIANGQEVAVCDSLLYQSIYCQSYTCYVWNNGTATCIAAVASSQPIPYRCSSDSDCISDVSPDTGAALSGVCECGDNPTGLSYCGSMTGDLWSQKYIIQLMTYFDTGLASYCNRVLAMYGCQWIAQILPNYCITNI